jgi:hypothetical protein
MNEIFDYCIVITTFDRPKMLEKSIEQLNVQQNNFKIKILIFDDGSTEKYELNPNLKYFKFFPNRGKKKFWKTIDTVFKVVQKIESKYYIFLQDDVEIKKNLFIDLKNRFEGIDDVDKICLSFLTDQRTKSPNWTNYEPIMMDEIIKTQWTELHFICQKKFFEVLDYKLNPIPMSRWDKNPNLSSGVGWQLSNRLNKMGYTMYHTKETFVNHGNHESKMNKTERMNNKLVT